MSAPSRPSRRRRRRRRVGDLPRLPLHALHLAGGHARALFRRHEPLQPGARPGALGIPRDAPRPRIHAFVFAPDRCEEHELTDLAPLASMRDAEEVAWIDVQGFGDAATLEEIRQVFDLHPLALADAVNVPQRPKLEDYGAHHLIVMRMARLGANREVLLEQVSFLIGPGWLLTFQQQPGDVFDPVRERLRAGVGQLRRGREDYLAYALLDALIDGYFPVAEALGEALDDLEEEVMDRPTRATLARIHRVRRTLLALHRIQWRQRDAVNALLRDEASPFRPDVRLYLRDAYDHAFQILDVIETYREMAVGLMDIYLSSVSNRMNEVMKTLTVMASIFIPLTFVVGIYGMNFDHMPELHWRWGYAAVWGGMVALAIGLVGWFWRRGWLGGSEAGLRDDELPPPDAPV